MLELATIGRLAPSPTGALHIGNARTFLLTWLSARQKNGRLFLRIEDIDSPRVKSWAIEQTLEDLEWLGLDWDACNQPSSKDAQAKVTQVEKLDGVLVQSTRLPRYETVLDSLVSAGQVYPCICSRKDVEEAASAPHDRQLPALETTVYPGTCKNRSIANDSLNKKGCYRWAFGPGEMQWDDDLLGPQAAVPKEQLGDFVIAKTVDSKVIPAYQLAVVVDDFDQGVNEVIRGDDLIFSTYRQLAIQRFLGWPTPRYRHLPLMVGPDGKRLAKRHGDTRLSQLRALGIPRENVVGYLAHTAGMLPEPRPCAAEELIGKLNWSDLPRNATVFDMDRDLPLIQQL